MSKKFKFVVNKNTLRSLENKKKRAVMQVTEELKLDSNKLAPMNQGDLIRSSDVSFDKDKGRVTYDTPYAVRLHEHPEFNFRQDRNPRAQGKYLETAARQNKNKYLKLFRQLLKV